MANGPCLNPNCKSNGKPHPNCRCYAGMAEGGSLGHFCQQKQPHAPDCAYYMGDGESFAEGGAVSGFIPDAEFKPDQSTASTGFIPDSQFKPDASEDNPEAQANAMEAQNAISSEKSGGIGNQLLTGLASAARVIKPGAEDNSSMTVRGKPLKLGISPVVSEERLKELKAENPVSSAVGTVVGLMTLGGPGAALEKVGTAVADRLIPEVAERGILRGMSRGAIKGAAENATYQTTDETAKMLANDPDQSVGSAISNIGLAGVIGGAIGGGLGSINPLWKATVGERAGQLVSDFKARMREHLELPEVIEPPKSEAPPQAPATKEAYDPFTKEKTTIKTRSQESKEGPKFDPFTKQEIPQAKIPEAKPLGETNGGKLADMFVKHADTLSGKAMGSATGAAIGHATGIPYGGTIGAILGERALGPILESVLPALTKPIIEKFASAEGIKAATEYSLAVAKGAKLADNAVTGLFKSGSKIIPDSKQPDENSRKKLEIALQSIKKDPERITQVGGQVGHYMPNHAIALGSMASNVSSFLNSLRPQSVPKAVLDTPKPIPKAVQAQYDRALDIAQQPLSVLESVKNGTVTSHDIMALQKMYPSLYQNLKQKIMSNLVDEVSKGNTIPYELKLGLSLFMGEPLDSTMQPMAIMAAQPTPQPASQQAQGGKKLTQDAGSKMIKGSKSMQTAAQASEAMHSSGAKA